MIIRSPFVTKDKAVREAAHLLKETNVVTDLSDIKRELSHIFTGNNGGGGVGGGRRAEVYFNEAMPVESCRKLKGVPIHGPDGEERCILRSHVDPKQDDRYEVEGLKPAER